MKNKIPILITVIILPLILTACGKSSQDGSKNTSTSTSKSGDSQSPGIIKGNLFDLLALGKNYKCTYSNKTEHGEFSGVTYISGDRAKSEMTMIAEADEQKIDMSMYVMVDKEWAYMWGPMIGALKTKTEKYKESTLEQQEKQQQAQSAMQDFDYKCENWKVDESVFKLPEGVEFSDMEEFLNSMKGMTEELQKNVGNTQE